MTNKMNFFISILLMVTNIQCLISEHFENDKYMPVDYVVMSDKIISTVIIKLEKRYNVKVVGRGSGIIDCVNRVGITFQINRALPLEKIREMLIDMMEEFLAAFNANEQIRPFLKNYPFTVKEIDVSVFLRDQNGRRLYEPDICGARTCVGKVWYDVLAKGSGYEYKEVKRESYEEALEIVQGKKE